MSVALPNNIMLNKYIIINNVYMYSVKKISKYIEMVTFLIKINGASIKNKRIEKNLTQQELADGICKQATISNIERKNYCTSINILGKICARLDLKINEVVEDTEFGTEEKLLRKVDLLCQSGRHLEAYQVIIEDIDEEKVKKDKKLLLKYYYFLGITNLIGKKNIEKSIVYFNKVLKSDNVEQALKVTAISSIAIAFSEKKDYELAKSYYIETLEAINTMEEIPLSMNKVFYNSAKFFSSQHEYKKALGLADEGITLNKKYKSIEVLDFLMYEKAYNYKKVFPQKTNKYVDYALMMAELNDNEHLKEIIKSDLANNEL